MGIFTGQTGKFFTKKIPYFEKFVNSIIKPSVATTKKPAIDLTPGCCGEEESREKCCE